MNTIPSQSLERLRPIVQAFAKDVNGVLEFFPNFGRCRFDSGDEFFGLCIGEFANV